MRDRFHFQKTALRKTAATRRSVVAALASIGLAAGCGSTEQRPNVLLVTVDTLRADHLGVYGFPGESSPNLDAFADRAVVFERAIAASSRTAPSHASLFTSRWVRDHSIGPVNGATRLGDEPTLAGVLTDASWDTAAFVSNSMLRRRIGLGSGFRHYDDRLPERESNREMFERVAEKTTAQALAWLARPRDRPFFLWVQYNDPHGPYTPPVGYAEGFTAPAAERGDPLPALDEDQGVGGIPRYQLFREERRAEQYLARYTGEIRYFDEWLGKLLAAVEGATDREAIIVFTADHGESLGEEDVYFSHGAGTTPNLVHVPLVVRAPGVEPGRVGTLVHHVDVAPTLLELLGLGELPDAAGRSLVPLLRRTGPLPERVVFADIGAQVTAYRGDRFLRAELEEERGALRWHHAAFRWERDGTWEAASPERDLESAVADYTSERAPLRVAPPPPPDDEARLRALGYVVD